MINYVTLFAFFFFVGIGKGLAEMIMDNHPKIREKDYEDRAFIAKKIKESRRKK